MASVTISIHAPREGSDKGMRSFVRNLKISIHAPREGSDSKTVQKTDACFVINGNFAKLNSQGSTWLAC